MKTISLLLASALLTAPIAAPAQFGGFGKKMLGGGSASSVSSTDAETFLLDATRSTKNVMISTALLAQALVNHNDLAGQKAEIAALSNAQDIKELDAHSATLSSSLDELNKRQDLAGDLTAAYNSGNATQKKLIAAAVGNLAIGIYRNTRLAGEAPGMVKGIGGNPQLLTRVGQFRMAAGLLGLQAKGLGSIAGAMPKLLSAVKVKAPDAAGTTEPQTITL